MVRTSKFGQICIQIHNQIIFQKEINQTRLKAKEHVKEKEGPTVKEGFTTRSKR